MASSFMNVFSNVLNNPAVNEPLKSSVPMLNEISNFSNSFLFSENQVQIKKTLYRLCAGTAELNAFLNKIAVDTTQFYHFENANPKESGRNKIMKANKFAIEVALDKTMEAQIYDTLATGDSYGWVGKLSKDVVEKELSLIMQMKSNIETKERDNIQKEIMHEIMHENKITDEFVPGTNFDEDLRMPRKYRYVPSSTVENLFNVHDIIGYTQIVNARRIRYDPKEMIHFTLQQRNGKVRGFTSVESILIQIELIRSMWQNMLSVYKNGGAPDKLFILENTHINSPAYKRMEQQLQKYKLVENQHGNMLFTGKVNVQDLTQLSEMQFKDSGLYITGVFAMQWGIAKSSIPIILGDANTKDESGGNSERGYWQCIKKFQKTYSSDMNSQLWIKHFGVKIVFDNPHLQFDVQKETALQLRLNNIQQKDTILAAEELQLNKECRLKLLGLTTEDVEKKKMLDIDPMTGNSLADQPSKAETEPNTAKQDKSKKKKTEQIQSQMSTGTKPTGVGKEQTSSLERIEIKELDSSCNIEYKSMGSMDTNTMNLKSFIRIYNEDRAYQAGKPPRIFIKENPDFVSMKFKSSDFVIKTVLTKEEFDNNQILLMNIGTNFYRL